ncbi:MAG TPA: chalcone isomerase family protein [Vicinamibacteria bacterium]|nr:chalcone isomerase family protein [Vicinamibacteria bacterium]
MRKTPLVASALIVLALAAAAFAQTWTEPKSGTAFDVSKDGMTLLGAGLRVKKVLFTFKAYAVGFYVDDAALRGPLAAFKGRTSSPEFYQALHTGDFRKEVVLHFLRNIGQKTIQDAMRESLAGADPKTLDEFISYFPQVKEGEQCVLRWAPGGTLESVMAGQAKPPIASRAFAERLFGLYVGSQPIQADIKADVVARAKDVLK